MANTKEASGSCELSFIKDPLVRKLRKRLESNFDERVLGVKKARDGSDTNEFSFKVKQTKALAKKIRDSPFTRTDAEVVYR